MAISILDGLPGDEVVLAVGIGIAVGISALTMGTNDPTVDRSFPCPHTDEIVKASRSPSDVRPATTSPAESEYWDSLDRWRGGTRTDGEYYYEWDHTDGHIEVYDKKTGKHVGTKDANGEWKGGPKPGREIDR